MKRRPHWDDELIFAVMSAAGDGGHLFIDDIHAVIAAVEDWQDANGFSRAGTLMHRLIAAEAAIQRVRSACNRIIENAQRFDLDDEHGLVYGQWMTAKSILRALDGDA